VRPNPKTTARTQIDERETQRRGQTARRPSMAGFAHGHGRQEPLYRRESGDGLTHQLKCRTIPLRAKPKVVNPVVLDETSMARADSSSGSTNVSAMRRSANTSWGAMAERMPCARRTMFQGWSCHRSRRHQAHLSQNRSCGSQPAGEMFTCCGMSGDCHSRGSVEGSFPGDAMPTAKRREGHDTGRRSVACPRHR